MVTTWWTLFGILSLGLACPKKLAWKDSMTLLHSTIDCAYRLMGRTGYKVDRGLKGRELIVSITSRIVPVLRGAVLGLGFKSRKGITMIGPRVTLRGTSRLEVGKNLNIERDVELNTMARNGVVLGDNVTIKRGTIIECAAVLRSLGDRLVVGDRVGFSPYCYICIRGPVEIGSDTIFGPGAMLYSENHIFDDLETAISAQVEVSIGVTIGQGCWIASQATILDGVTLGDGCVVAANSVVTKSFEANAIIAGVPARKIGMRNAKS